MPSLSSILCRAEKFCLTFPTRDSHWAQKEALPPQVKGCRLWSGHEPPAAPVVGATAGCKGTHYTVAVQSKQPHRCPGCDSRRRAAGNSGPGPWRQHKDGGKTPGSSMCQHRIHTPPQIPQQALSSSSELPLSNSGLTCSTSNLFSTPPHSPSLARDDRKTQNLSGEKGSLQLAVYT